MAADVVEEGVELGRVVGELREVVRHVEPLVRKTRTAAGGVGHMVGLNSDQPAGPVRFGVGARGGEIKYRLDVAGRAALKFAGSAIDVDVVGDLPATQRRHDQMAARRPVRGTNQDSIVETSGTAEHRLDKPWCR